MSETMKIEGKTFYFVGYKEDRQLFQKRVDATDKLKEILKDSGIAPADVRLQEISLEGDKWIITQVPWMDIALELIRQ